MAIEVDVYEQIRQLHENGGHSQRAIARILGVSRNTVKKYYEGARVPWERQGGSGRQRYVITEEIMKFIKDCFADDEAENIKKQEHTAKRIYDRLVAEKGFYGGESTIRQIVAALKEKQGPACRQAGRYLYHCHLIPEKQHKMTGARLQSTSPARKPR